MDYNNIKYVQATFTKWLSQVLVPYRTKLGKADQRMVLILDGHSTHRVQASLDFCAANNIDLCFLPAHTSHITQPLDVGVFNSYKAAYRRNGSNPKLNDIRIRILDVTSNAGKARIRMLGRALISHQQAVTAPHIRDAFYNTRVFPISKAHFINRTTSILGVPAHVRTDCAEVERNEEEEWLRNANAAGRIDISDQLLIVAEN